MITLTVKEDGKVREPFEWFAVWLNDDGSITFQSTGTAELNDFVALAEVVTELNPVRE